MGQGPPFRKQPVEPLLLHRFGEAVNVSTVVGRELALLDLEGLAVFARDADRVAVGLDERAFERELAARM